MQGEKDYQEKLFIRFQLSDYIPADNFYRQLKAILDLSFLYKSTAQYYGTEGQKSIGPVVFMKLMLVGYLENLNSDRRIRKASRMRLYILYFLDYDLDEELPWHSTLSRTRQLYGEEQFSIIFKQVLKLCINAGMVSGKRQVVDSVFVQANSSMESLIEREVFYDAEQYARELKEHEKDPEVIRFSKTRLKNNRNNYDKSKPMERRTNKSHISYTDHEARLSFKPGKPFRMNYMSQVCVDTSNHVITTIQASLADRRDSQCLPEILDEAASVLNDNGLTINEVLADSNYSSMQTLKYLKDVGIDGYIPNAGAYQATREGFTFDKENDRYICHQGRHLPFSHFAKDRRGNINKIYSSKITECANCPFLAPCAKKARRKAIEDGIDRYLFDEMHHRVRTLKGQKMKSVRQSTVEPVLGSLINYFGMKRVNTKGLKQANKCMMLAAMAYNLKKLLKFTSIRSQENIQKLKKEVRTSFNLLFTCIVTVASYGISVVHKP